MSNRIPMTAPGIKNLKEELIQRKSTDRPKIIEEIAEARAHGDLKENAEYHAAREKQGFNEGRILEIESVLSKVQEIEVSKLNVGDKVVFSAFVTLKDHRDNSIHDYQIVGEYETDLPNNRISINSPIARSLIGKSKGDTVLVKIPSGEVEYTIENVSY